MDATEAIYKGILLTQGAHYIAALKLLAAMAVERKNFAEAVEWFKQVLQIEPHDPNTLNNLGGALKGLKRYEEALSSYDKAIAIKGDYAEALLNRGALLSELHRYDEAIVLYNKVISLNPDHAEAHTLRINTLKELKRCTIRNTIKIPPSAPKVLLVSFKWTNLMEMPHVIKRAGFHVDVLCPFDNWAIKNSFYDHWINSGDSLDSLIESLLTLVREKVYTYILIGDDPILWKIYRENINALWDLLPIRNPSALALLNKIGLAEHCRNHSIPCPLFYPVADKGTACEALQILGLPLIVKENYSFASNGVRVFRDESSYFQFMEAYDFSEPLLVQRLMDGDLVAVEALFKHGKLLEYACSVSINETLRPSTKRRFFPNDIKIGDIITRLGDTSLLHGFANISLIQDKLSQDYFLFEADPRTNKWISYASWFGHDFALAFRRFLSDSESAEGEVSGTVNYQDIDCWEVEHYPDHVIKLIGEGRNTDLLLHLFDYDRNYRYMMHDPLLFEEKMNVIRKALNVTNGQ